jgi:predicted nucleic acid-binding Zn ribbon protein
MPTYSTQCEGCGVAADVRLSFVDYESVKLGAKTLECSSCQGKVNLAFNPGNVNFVMKDGESGGWTSKAGRENVYRARRNKILDKKTKDHVFKTKLIPNYGGQQTENWREAQEAARKEGGNTATYDPLIKREGSNP